MDTMEDRDKKRMSSDMCNPKKLTFREALEELMKSPDRVIILVRKDEP